MDRAQEDHRMISAPAVAALWLFSLAVLLIGIGNPPVTRTQEARVLETARQMLGTGFHGWMEPTLNGEPRMKKPPLCYWMTAGAYEIGGISEGVGRIPTALLGWITLGVTYLFARRLFDQRAAVFTCAILLGSMFFYRFSRMAETDPAVMCFLTLAIYSVYRSSESRSFLWPHLVAVAIALVVLSKGAPAVFAGIFLISWCAVERRWDVLRRFIISGAPITMTVIAVPWFLMVPDQSASELQNTITGGDHFAWPWYYVPVLFGATAPWTLIFPVAVYSASRQWKSSPSIRLVLIWLLSIFIPLCINGNKQNHYMVMLLPPLMMLMGGFLAAVPVKMEPLVKLLLLLTAIGCVVGAVAGPPIISTVRGEFRAIDWIAALTLGATAILVRSRWKGGLDRIIPAMLGAAVLLMPIIVGFWIPSSDPHNGRDSAREIKAMYGDRNYIYFGQNASVSLSFYLRETIPSADTSTELMEQSGPGTVAIAITRNQSAPPSLPEPFEYRTRIEDGNQTLALYVYNSP